MAAVPAMTIVTVTATTLLKALKSMTTLTVMAIVTSECSFFYIHATLFVGVLHLQLYQDGKRLVTVHMHGVFIVLLHWIPGH